MHPFQWLRNAARNAVLGGVRDAVEQLAAEGAAAITVQVELPALPAPPEEKPARSRKEKP